MFWCRSPFCPAIAITGRQLIGRERCERNVADKCFLGILHSVGVISLRRIRRLGEFVLCYLNGSQVFGEIHCGASLLFHSIRITLHSSHSGCWFVIASRRV